MSAAIKWTLIGLACLVAGGAARYLEMHDIAAALIGAGLWAFGKEHGKSSRERERPVPHVRATYRTPPGTMALTLALALHGCGAQAVAQRARRVAVAETGLGTASKIVDEARAQLSQLCGADVDPRCAELADSIGGAVDAIESGRRALDAVDAAGDKNVGAILMCSAAAVGRVVKALAAFDREPSREIGEAWAAYVSAIGGTMCDYRDPDAHMSGGEAPGPS